MGGSSSRSVFGKQKKNKPTVRSAWKNLKRALPLKTPKKNKKQQHSLLTLHGLRLKKPKKEEPFKRWQSLVKKKTNWSVGSSRPRKESVFKTLTKSQKGGKVEEGHEKEGKAKKSVFVSNNTAPSNNKAPSWPFPKVKVGVQKTNLPL